MTVIITGAYQEMTLPTPIALIAAFISIFTKEGMYWYTLHYARKINSSAFIADAWHHRSDALSSVGSLVGIGGAMLGFPILEPIAGVSICICVLKVSYDILKDSLDKMLDTPCSPLFEHELLELISSQEGILGIDSLYTRQFGSKVYVDVEIRLDGCLSLSNAHNIAENVHDVVEKAHPEIKHIMIHQNPDIPNEKSEV